MYKHVMYDIETLGKHADCVILSIGARAFDLDSPDGLGLGPSIHMVLNVDDQVDRGIDLSVVKWWMNQSEAARKSVSGEGLKKQDAEKLLNTLWEQATPGRFKNFAWSRGANFDLPILNHWWRETLGHKHEPWHFRNARCVRTIEALIDKELWKVFDEAPIPESITWYSKQDGVNKHNAEYDATKQAWMMFQSLRYLRNRGVECA